MSTVRDDLTPVFVTIHRAPALWDFVLSKYFVGLIATSLVLFRIKNVILPSRRASPRKGLHQSTLGRLHDTFFPVNFEKTTTRIALQAPSICFLLKAMSFWLLVMLQIFGTIPLSGSQTLKRVTSNPWVNLDFVQVQVENLDRWFIQKPMDDICWVVFCAAAASVIIETFIKTLDGVASGMHHSPTADYLNLFTFAFLLHDCAPIFSHALRFGPGLPSRPAKDKTIYMSIVLFQRIIYHLLFAVKRLSTKRLIPTTFAAIMSLVVFHSSSTFMVSRSSLLYLIPGLLVSWLIAVVLLAFTLNVITQLYVKGFADYIFLIDSDKQSGDTTSTRISLRKFLHVLPADAEFVVVLLQLGTASLNSTQQLIEQGGQATTPAFLVTPTNLKEYHPTHGTINIGRSSVAKINPGYDTALPALSASTLHFERVGFSNEVRHIQLGLNVLEGQKSHDEISATFLAFLSAWKGVMRCLFAKTKSSSSSTSARSESGVNETTTTAAPVPEATKSEGEEEATRNDIQEEAMKPNTDILLGTSAERNTLLGSSSQNPSHSISRTSHFSYTFDEPPTPLGDSQPIPFNQCVICNNAPRDIICWPCRCLAVCDQCRMILVTHSSSPDHHCPCCRQRVEGYSRLYFP